MKKTRLLFLSCIAAGCALSAQAKVITPAQAKALASKYVSVGNLSKQKTFSVANDAQQKDAPGFYAFNDSRGQGFVLIAGDDCVRPVLGYSTTGSIDTDHLPPAMEAWLKDVSASIASKRKAGNGTAATATDDTSQPSIVVGPLVKTKWDQAAPYHDMTPTMDGKHCLTGCVATATAQVMNYYQWPVKGTGSVKYDTPNYDQKTCEVDFSKSTYDWADMLNEYGSREDTADKPATWSEASGKAVARLMSDLGAALHMEYDTLASGAMCPDVATAAVYHFGYDAELYHQNNYTKRQWTKMIEKFLDDGCPLVYCGDTKSMRSMSHCFVVDGYDSNNYLHVNWGWSGEGDGYFYFYNFGTNATTNYRSNMTFAKITPNKTGTIQWDAPSPLRIRSNYSQIYNRGDIKVNKYFTTGIDNLDADLDIGLLYFSWSTYKGDITLGCTPENGDGFTPLVSLKGVEIQRELENFPQQVKRFHLGSDDVKGLADGRYLLTFQSKRTDSGLSANGAPVTPCFIDADKNLMLIKQDGKVGVGFVKKPMARLTAMSAIAFDKKEYDFSDVAHFKFKVGNNTEGDFDDQIKLIIANKDSTEYYSITPTEIFGGDSIEITGEIPVAYSNGFREGSVNVSLGQEIDGKVVALEGSTPVMVKANRNDDKLPVPVATKVELTGYDGPLTSFDKLVLDYDDMFEFGADIEYLPVAISPEHVEMTIFANVNLNGRNYNGYAFVNNDDIGRSTDVSISGMFSQEDIGMKGRLNLLYRPMFDNELHLIKYKGKDFSYPFTVVDKSTGVDDVTTGKSAKEMMRFDAEGRRIETPAKGLNIIRMSDGTVRKVIIR